MEASRITITKRTMKSGERMIDILRFLQESQAKNPRFLKSTSLKQLAKCYVLNRGNGNTDTVKATLGRLVKKNAIVVSRISSGRNARANYRINYLYPGLPQDFIDKASNEDKQFIEDIYARLKKKQDAGENCTLDRRQEVIITKPTPIKKEPVSLPKPVDSPKINATATVPIPVSTPIEVSKQGNNISITINLNLNGLS